MIKENKIQIEQAFFGNGPSGYQLLDITDKKYSSLVTKYCGAIGTPDGLSEVSPFLFSVPIADNVLMFCCQRGELDPSGRPTLFFHAMIANLIEAKQFNVNAYTLYNTGCFKNHIADSCKPLILARPFEKLQSSSAIFIWDGSPLAIVSAREEKNLLCSLLGNHVNEIAWSSFTFQPLPNFTLYVISKYVMLPQDRKCVSSTGQILSSGPIKGVRMMEPSMTSIQSKASKNWLSLFFLSMLINIVLICAIVSLYKQQNIISSPNPIKNKILNREDVINELRDKFPESSKILNFDEIMNKDERLKGIIENPNKELGEDGLIDKIKEYIDFVNKEIIVKQKQGEDK